MCWKSRVQLEQVQPLEETMKLNPISAANQLNELDRVSWQLPFCLLIYTQKYAAKVLKNEPQPIGKISGKGNSRKAKQSVNKGRESAKDHSRSEKHLECGRGEDVKGSSPIMPLLSGPYPSAPQVAVMWPSRVPSQPSLFRTEFSRLLCFTVSTG